MPPYANAAAEAIDSPRPDPHRRHDDREDQIPRGVALDRHARVAHEVALRFGEGFKLAEERALPEGEIDASGGHSLT